MNQFDADARIDHEPEFAPTRQEPLTTFCTANVNKSVRGALRFRSTVALHVPENSPAVPTTFARHAPLHSLADLMADHPPRMAG